MLFGFNSPEIQEENGLSTTESLAFQLVVTLHSLESSFWAPFICELLERYPIHLENTSPSPAFFWKDTVELKGTYLLDRLKEDKKYFNNLLQKFQQSNNIVRTSMQLH